MGPYLHCDQRNGMNGAVEKAKFAGYIPSCCSQFAAERRSGNTQRGMFSLWLQLAIEFAASATIVVGSMGLREQG